ncbi:MAG: MFS transporter [Acidimicrobiia bacterium]|nr:MFS transporter [Acidimicrobiia bacterium]
MAVSQSTFRSALAHRDYRWLASAFVISNIGSWAYNVALIVWVFETTESAAWVGATSLARFLPSLFFSAYGGVLAERFERRNLVVLLNGTSALTHVLLGITVAVDGPIVVALVLAAVSTMQGTVYEPAIVALTPQIVGESDLAAANSLNGMIDNGAVVVGPAVGAGLLVLFAPPVALLVNAATFVYAAFATSRVRTRSHPTDVTEGGKGPLAQMMVGVKALAESQLARALAGFSIVASFFYGTDTVLLVVLSDEKLGTGPTGFGYLLAALGVGGVLAGPFVNRLAASPRLGTVIGIGLAAYTVPTALMIFVDEPVIGFLLQVVRGAGTLVVDVLAITAMQRTLPQELVSRVFGVFISLVLAAISLGALLTPILLDVFGLTTTLLIFGVGPVAIMLLGISRLLIINRIGSERLADLAGRISVLEVAPLFASLARGSLELLASAATEVAVPKGTEIVTEGEDADAMYLIISGVVEVTARRQGTDQQVHVVDLGPGDYFGEIGLLESAPRNASCTAASDCQLFRIDGEAFTQAVQAAPQTGFLDRARHREAQTHRLVDRTRSKATTPGAND